MATIRLASLDGRKKRIQMADLDIVQHNFEAVVDAFNHHQLDSVMAYLDDQVSVYSISNKTGYFPKAAAKVYFDQQFRDNPEFTPDHLKKAPIGFNPGSTAAIITDAAGWSETRGGVVYQSRIIYTFTLVKRGGMGGAAPVWTFTSLWGA